MSLTIYGLPTGSIYAPLASTILNGGFSPTLDRREIIPWGYEESMKFSDGSTGPGVESCVSIWYIDGAEQKVLVDTSFDNCENVMNVLKKYGGNQVFKRKEEQEIVNALKKVNITPEQIDIVIHTHLHFDHSGNDELFKNASFIVQRDEIPWALTPPPYGMWYYREFSFHFQNVLDRVKAIEGDVRITKGIEVWKLGGHTPGSMAVVVDTDIGRVALAGDVAVSYRNLEFRWPGGFFCNIEQVIRAYDRLLKETDIVVPSHDWEFFEKFPRGKIG